ncbi:MAG: hypothetical protein JSS66_16395 [Armatimonadetes bacterium]|nr:hypothetical protein [Armatimonadota bacterium]
MERLRILVLIVSLLAAMTLEGCAPKEETASSESVESKAAAQQAASEWTEEQKAGFKLAHERARKGLDDSDPDGAGKRK